MIVVVTKCAERAEQGIVAIAFCDCREYWEKVKVLGADVNGEPCPDQIDRGERIFTAIEGGECDCEQFVDLGMVGG